MKEGVGQLNREPRNVEMRVIHVINHYAHSLYARETEAQTYEMGACDHMRKPTFRH